MSRRVGFGNNSAPYQRVKHNLWDRQLAEGEEILWEGRPGFGFKLNLSALKSLVIVAVAIGFIAPQIFAANQFGAPIEELLEIPFIGSINVGFFVIAALVWTVIWFFMQTTTTPFFARYLLTNRRAFIAKTLLIKRIKSYEITPFRPVEYDGRPKGSILFATEFRRADNGKKRDFPIGFMHIDDAESVYKHMVEIQRERLHE